MAARPLEVCAVPEGADFGSGATEERLRGLFPRGRFTKQADGMPILVARSKRLAGCHVFEQAPGRLLGLSYVGSPRRWRTLLGDLVVRHLAGDGEGVLYVFWCPEAARRLRAFSRGRQGSLGAVEKARLVTKTEPRNGATAHPAPTPGATLEGPERPGDAS